ncbi:hypothetical protein [Peribacillus frigoritolerans]|uniref:hypothetical protein n=1 Tax=Peribacillus frigoritolerans TaxID=450367 RepID=UPI002E9BEFA6|nr:hypothetical protein [Peribacillus frigoritolerans]
MTAVKAIEELDLKQQQYKLVKEYVCKDGYQYLFYKKMVDFRCALSLATCI